MAVLVSKNHFSNLLLALVVVEILSVMICEAGFFTSFGSVSRFGVRDELTKNMKEKELAEHDARAAYKDLFVRSGKYSHKEVIARLKALQKFESLNLPFDVNLLLSYDNIMKEKCDDYPFMKNMRSIRDQISNNKDYSGIQLFMEDVFKRQIKTCNYAERFKQKLDAFRNDEPKRWSLIEDVNRSAGGFGKVQTKYKDSDHTTNHIQMNEVLDEMMRQKFAQHGHDQAQYAYKLALDIRKGCQNFAKLEKELEMVELDLEWKKSIRKEVRDWQRYMSVCKQASQTNYERSLGDAFGYAYWPEMQNAWESYREWAELWA